MKPFLRNQVIAILGFLITCSADAQKIGIDREEKSVFTYYSLPDSRFSLSADGNISYSFLLQKPDTISFVLKKDRTVTIKKLQAWTMDIELSTEEDFLSSEKLSTLRPGVEIKIGRQTTVDSFRSLETKLPSNKKSVKTYGGNLIFGIANLKYYDSVKKKSFKRGPLTYGVEAYYNMIFKNRDADSKHRIILAFNASLTRSWNDDELISYQKVSDAIITPDVVALEDFDGRYGVLERNLTDFRFSVSLPIYLGHINPIPFVAQRVREHAQPAYYFGLFTNILNSDDLLKPELFKIPTSLGCGIDWKYQNSTLSKASFFIKGEIGFGK